MKSKFALGMVGVAAVAALWFMFLGRDEPAPESTTDTPGSTDRQAMRKAPRSEGVPQDVARLSEQRRPNRDGWSTGQRAEHEAAGSMRGAAKPAAESSRDPGAAAQPATADRRSAPPANDDAAEFESLKRALLSDNDPAKRIDAIESITTFDDELAMPVLVQALNDRDPEVRRSALEELGNFDEEDQVPFEAFANAMRDSDPEVRLEALRIVGDSEDERAAELVQQALTDSDEDVRSEAQDIEEIDSD